jgi:hypothetical protein
MEFACLFFLSESQSMVFVNEEKLDVVTAVSVKHFRLINDATQSGRFADVTEYHIASFVRVKQPARGTHLA